jgi:hypothetical protein
VKEIGCTWIWRRYVSLNGKEDYVSKILSSIPGWGVRGQITHMGEAEEKLAWAGHVLHTFTVTPSFITEHIYTGTTILPMVYHL